MATYTYKNISNNTVVVPNIGEVAPSKTIDSPVMLNHEALAIVEPKVVKAVTK